MNIDEIVSYKPKAWMVVALGVPLVLLTILIPLVFETLLRTIIKIWSSRPFHIAVFVVGVFIFIFTYTFSYVPNLVYLRLAIIPTVILGGYSMTKFLRSRRGA